MLMDARLFLCQGFVLLCNPSSIGMMMMMLSVFHLALGSCTLHSQEQGEDVAFWNPIRFFFLIISPAFHLLIDFLQCLTGEKVGGK